MPVTQTFSPYAYLRRLVLAMLAAGLCIGLSDPLLEKLLYYRHINAATMSGLFLPEALGFLVLAPFLPKLMGCFRADRLILAGLILLAATFIGLMFEQSLLLLALLRGVMGAAKSILFIVGATVLNNVAERRHLGGLIGVFAASFLAAEGVAPLLINLLPFGVTTLAVLMISVLVVSMIPFAMHSLPCHHVKDAVNVKDALVIVHFPLVMLLAFLQSINASAFEELFFDYALSMGYSLTIAGILNSIVLLSAVLLAQPIQMLAERQGYGQLTVIAVLVMLLGYGAMYALGLNNPITWAGSVLLGGGALGYYVIAMVVMSQHYKGLQLASIMAGFMIASTVFEALFALVATVVMEDLGMASFPIMMMVLNFLGLVSGVWLLWYHRSQKHRPNRPLITAPDAA